MSKETSVTVCLKETIMRSRTGRFGAYLCEKNVHLGYARYLNRITEIVSDGRNYLIWVRSSNVHSEIAEMFTNDTGRVKISVRIVLEDYTKAEIGEFTVLPNDAFSHPEIERSSLSSEDSYPIEIAKVGDVYLEEAGWVAPNYQPAWLRIASDKYDPD